MNERSFIEASEPTSVSVWGDHYLPANYVEQPKGPQFDVAWLRGALFRQRWLIGSVLVLALMGGIAFTLLTPPTYEATATVRVSPWGNKIVEGDASSQIVSPSEIKAFMQTQVEIVQSRSLAEQVARELNLGKRNDLLGADVDEGRPANRTDAQWEEDKVKLAAQILQSSVTATLPTESQIIAISVTSEEPTLAAEIANGYAKAFVQTDVRRSIDSNAYGREYLLKQIEQVRARLNDSELAANAYARNSGIVTQQTMGSDKEGASSTIVGANLSSVNETFAEVRANRIAAEQKWRAISNLPAAQIPEVLGSPVVQELTAERAKLSAELSVLRQRYNDDFPAIADIRSRLSLIDQQIERTGADVKASIRGQFVVARQQEEAMQRELASVTSDALVEQDKKVEYTGLEREAEALRAQLTNLLDRFNQINAASNLQSSSITPLDTAMVPDSPIAPSLPRNLLLALVLGVAAAGGLAMLREVFVDQFRRSEDIEDRLGLPFLGQTPFVKVEDLAKETGQQFSTLMEAYAAIRSTIDFAVPRHGAVVQFTSSQAAEGKSTTALILAQLFARLGRSVLLIDADLRKPSIHHLLDMERPQAGLVEVLLGHASFDEAKIETIMDKLAILPVAGIPPNPVELVSSQAFADFIEACRAEYSLVIIDSAPMLGLADAAETAKVADATVLVIEANRTSFAQASTSINRLRAVGANLLGSVLTKYRALEAGGDYAYQYTYYRYGNDGSS